MPIEKPRMPPAAAFPSLRCPRDAPIAELAGRQYGIVSRAQLVELGLTRHEVQGRLDAGRLHRLHHGVYAVGHRHLERRGRWLAAVLAAGPGAVLSHRAAGALWRVRFDAIVEVTCRRRRGSARGFVARRSSDLPADEVTVVDGIPVTSVSRTLLDLAAVLPRRQVERAIEQAEVLRLTDPLSLADLVERHPGRRGIATIRAILARGGLGLHVTRSDLERRFLDFVGGARMPAPAVNAVVEGFECDVVWREAHLIVELDGRSTHGTTEAFERDRLRDLRLSAAGWTVVRVTWRQLHNDRATLERDLRRLLARRRGAANAA